MFHDETRKFLLSAEFVAAGGIQFQDLVIDNQTIYWTEMRPAEGGRTVLLKMGPDLCVTECLGDYSVRTRVHEYGKGAFTVSNDVIYFINDRDQKLYKQVLGETPCALTNGQVRLADLHVTSKGIVAIAESHEDPSREPENFLALIDTETGEIKSLARGMDFYASPAISADESKIAWIAWSHPNMPWDDTTLWCADFTQGQLTNIIQIDPDDKAQSFFQPQWDIHNQLAVVSDKNNWWNLYRVVGQQLEPLVLLEGEIGQPMWVFGLSRWGFDKQGVVFIRTMPTGNAYLSYCHQNEIKTFDLPFTGFSHLRMMGDAIICFASSPISPTALIRIERNGKYTVIRLSNDIQMEPEDISRALHFTFSSREGRQAYGYFYLPTGHPFSTGHPSLPPLIVMCHGGPTGQANNAFNVEIQYWTMRGFAIVDVDYAGSTGYGRAYRQSLNGHWGEYDVQDCIAAVEALVKKGWVDPKKVVIVGGSAGGLTVLLALASSHCFQAGGVRYGVTDLTNLLQDTHKFESRYLDRLIGPYPEEKAKYDARSPMNHVEKIGCPVIFFHGDEDKVVPLSQTLSMVARLRDKGILCECMIFKGEQHGFRQASHRASVLVESQKFFLTILDLNRDGN